MARRDGAAIRRDRRPRGGARAPTGSCCPATAPSRPCAGRSPPPRASRRRCARRSSGGARRSSASASGCRCSPASGHEYETVEGLGWIDGEVVRIAPADPALKVPHMGWNDLVVTGRHPVLDGIATGDHAYFVHSWQMRVARPGASRWPMPTTAGPVTAIVGRGTVVGTQFHPEKSQATGLRLIANFLAWAP